MGKPVGLSSSCVPTTGLTAFFPHFLKITQRREPIVSFHKTTNVEKIYPTRKGHLWDLDLFLTLILNISTWGSATSVRARRR